jgi:hypothetical protein
VTCRFLALRDVGTERSERTSKPTFSKGFPVKSKFFPLALVALVSLVSLSAHALGFDVAGFVAQHSDVFGGLAMLGAGSIDLLSKSLDKIGAGLGETQDAANRV